MPMVCTDRCLGESQSKSAVLFTLSQTQTIEASKKRKSCQSDKHTKRKIGKGLWVSKTPIYILLCIRIKSNVVLNVANLLVL